MLGLCLPSEFLQVVCLRARTRVLKANAQLGIVIESLVEGGNVNGTKTAVDATLFEGLFVVCAM